MTLPDSGPGFADTGHWDPEPTQFARDWKSAGSRSDRPRIQDYLARTPEAERLGLFCDLLQIEVKCRYDVYEQPQPEEYCALLPGVTALVHLVFDRVERDRRGPTPPDTASAAVADGGEPRKPERYPETVTAEKDRSPPRSPGRGAEHQPVPGYQLLGELGRGGMGVVYKARHLRLDRLVALKMILPDRTVSPGPLKRFLTEAAVVAQFHHPHIVQIYDIGEHDGRPYFSLELLEGGTLGEKLAGTPVPPAEAAALIETLALAVGYAHQKGIIHRDLKPANILLATDGTPKVADFGLAKRVVQGDSSTIDGGIMGTPNYMAPEQAWGHNDEVGPAADIYALGGVLYELLTGRPPFQTADKWQTIELVRTQEPVPPRELVPHLPRDLELICLKCLKKSPALRFADARALADELRRFQDGRPILTRPTPVWELAWKWARRRPAVASLVAVSAAAVLCLILYLEQRARTAQHELQEQQRAAAMRGQAEQLILQAQESAGKGRLPDALGSIRAASEIVRTEPGLSDLEAVVGAIRRDFSRRAADQQAERAADEAYQNFFRVRDTALFHGMVFSGVELPGRVAATRAACREALAVFGVTDSPDAGPTFPPHLSEPRRQRCLTACYELLLVWAEAEAQTERAGDAPSSAQFERSVRLLDRAARLDVRPTAAYHVRRANYLDQRGEAAAAARERDLAAATRPAGALDYFLTGDTHQKHGRLAEAVRDFQRALHVEPDHFWARYFLAACHLQLQRPEQARDHLSACVVLRNDFLWLYLLRGFANSQLGDFAPATDDFNRALELKPDDQARYGILVNQGVLCSRQARQLEGPVVPAWFARVPHPGLAYRGVAEALRAERLAAATGFLRDATRLRPDMYPAYRYLASVAQQQRRWDEALAAADRAIEVARAQPPKVLAPLYSLRARVHRDRNDTDAALADLGRAVQLHPSPEDHAERGRLLHGRRKLPEALADYEASLRLQPGEAEVWRWKAEVLLALHREAEAVTALDRYFAERGRPTAEVFRTRGLARARLRQFTAAVVDLSEALVLRPDSTTHAERGWVLLANEAAPLALRDFEDAIRLDGKNAEAYAGRGLIRARSGRPDQAAADAEAALAHARPDTPRLLWNVAHVHAQLAAAFAADPAPWKPRTIASLQSSQEQTLDLIRRAIARVPEAERQAFWNQYITSDTLLDPVRGTPGFGSLDREYGKAERRPSEND